MNEQAGVARAIRGLTYALWCLCILMLAMLSMPIWGTWLYRPRSSSRTIERLSSGQSDSLSAFEVDFDRDFSARPLEDKIERASVILLTRRDADPGKHKAIVSEILKKKEGVRFYYKVGDEYERLTHFPRENCVECEGDGDLVFLTGNPAQMRESYSVHDGRVGGLGDITIEELRALAAAADASP